MVVPQLCDEESKAQRRLLLRVATQLCWDLNLGVWLPGLFVPPFLLPLPEQWKWAGLEGAQG